MVKGLKTEQQLKYEGKTYYQKILMGTFNFLEKICNLSYNKT